MGIERKSGPICTIFNSVHPWVKARQSTNFHQNISEITTSMLNIQNTWTNNRRTDKLKSYCAIFNRPMHTLPGSGRDVPASCSVRMWGRLQNQAPCTPGTEPCDGRVYENPKTGELEAWASTINHRGRGTVYPRN